MALTDLAFVEGWAFPVDAAAGRPGPGHATLAAGPATVSLRLWRPLHRWTAPAYSYAATMASPYPISSMEDFGFGLWHILWTT